MKYLILPILLLTLFACSTPEEDMQETSTEENTPDTPKTMTEESMYRHISAKLSILGTEKPEINIIKKDLDADDSTDWIVTVNLLDRAVNEAIVSGKVAKHVETGYMGFFNVIFYMDGKTKKIVGPINVASSAKAPLEVAFEHITSDNKLDFTVDMRVRDMKRRQFYTIQNGTPLQTCEQVIWDSLSYNNPIAYDISYEEGTYSKAKNIVVKEASIQQPDLSNPDNIYSVNPEITPKKNIVRKWYHSSARGIYFMKKDDVF